MTRLLSDKHSLVTFDLKWSQQRVRKANRQCESWIFVPRAGLKLTGESMASDSQSLLLGLPKEIKNHIYVLVCGGDLLHIKFASGVSKPKVQFRHAKCLSKTTEEDAQASFDTSTSPWFDEVNANRHEDCCSPKNFCDVSGRMTRRLTLDLRFLRTCRKIYDEAKNVCYTANIFSFDSWNVFGKFLKTVSWVSHIRSIHLRICSGTTGDGPSTREALQDVSSKLTGLQRIHIDLEQFHISRSRRYDRGAEEASHLTEQLLCFAGRALKTTAVIISDARFCDFNVPETTKYPWDDGRSLRLDRWTMLQKQEYSQFLRNAILQRRGKPVDIDGDVGRSRPFWMWWNGRGF